MDTKDAAGRELVDHPRHYAHPSGIEAIDLIEDLDFNTGNAVKYIMRRSMKTETPLIDLHKALWYSAREIERRRKLRAIPALPRKALKQMFADVAALEPANIALALQSLYEGSVTQEDGMLTLEPLEKACKLIEAEIRRIKVDLGHPGLSAGEVRIVTAGNETGAARLSSTDLSPDAEVVSLIRLLRHERSWCIVCHHAPDVERDVSKLIVVNCPTCDARVIGEAQGIAYERWITLISKQSPKPIGERVADVQLRTDPGNPAPH